MIGGLGGKASKGEHPKEGAGSRVGIVVEGWDKDATIG